MSVKSNRVNARIAYRNELLNRGSVTDEINFLLDLNKLLDMNKHLGLHGDHAVPVVTHESEGFYGCNINLQFVVRHDKKKLYEYSRLHYLLVEIAELCERYKGKFDRMERTLDISGMTQPWALVAAPQQVLLRKGATQYCATGDMIPGYVGHQQAVDGLVVMGEPRAVRDFKRAWGYVTRNYFDRMSPEERASLEASDHHYGPHLHIEDLQRQFPKIQWQHLLIWAHAKHVPGNDGWFVTNLDHNDNWLLAGVQYVNRNGDAMINCHLPWQPMWLSSPDLRFFKDMEVIEFDTKEVEEEIVDIPVTE